MLCACFVFGCASQEVVLRGRTSGGGRVYFSAPEEIPAVIERYYGIRDLTTEEGKIDYLINRVQSSHYVFVRNRVKYNAYAAAKFLRWKLERLKAQHHVEISTARDFIARVSTGSKMSGKPYLLEFDDGTCHYLSDILTNELEALESHLERYRKLAQKTLGEAAQVSPIPVEERSKTTAPADNSESLSTKV